MRGTGHGESPPNQEKVEHPNLPVQLKLARHGGMAVCRAHGEACILPYN